MSSRPSALPVPLRTEASLERRSENGRARTWVEATASAVAAGARLPARALLALIWLYQRTLSPVLPIVFGSACGCRFAPTCSHYAAEAIQLHGAVIGTFFAARRLIKCTPLHPGGLDPVPPRRRISCTRVQPHRSPELVASRQIA